MTKTRTALAVVLTASLAAPALAGNADAPTVDTTVATPAAGVQNSSPDWTGFYAGAQLGYADVTGNGDDVIGGITGGYDYDLGNWVIGAGLDYDFTDISIPGGADLESIFRAKLRGGYKIGDGLLYATGGYALADTNAFGSENGYFIGAGYEHRVTDTFSIGGEALYHEFDNLNGASDLEAATYQIRATYRF